MKIRIWKPKSRDWQLRITCGGVLIERDQGDLEAMLNHGHFYSSKQEQPPPLPGYTANIFGSCSRSTAEGSLDLKKVLTKKERRMLNWPQEEAK